MVGHNGFIMLVAKRESSAFSKLISKVLLVCNAVYWAEHS